MRPLLVVRPEPGNAASVAARALGLAVLGAPLFAVEAVAWTVPDPQGCAGILAGAPTCFAWAGRGWQR
jgi:uroporphyrinogen-III synthase